MTQDIERKICNNGSYRSEAYSEIAQGRRSPMALYFFELVLGGILFLSLSWLLSTLDLGGFSPLLLIFTVFCVLGLVSIAWQCKKNVGSWATKNLLIEPGELVTISASEEALEVNGSSASEESSKSFSWSELKGCSETGKGLFFLVNERYLYLPKSQFLPIELEAIKSRIGGTKPIGSSSRFLFSCFFPLAAICIVAHYALGSVSSPKAGDVSLVEKASSFLQVEGARTKILFIGNSLTSSFRIPSQVCSILNDPSLESNQTYECQSLARGGAWLKDHVPTLNSGIVNQDWDIVVLQEQSMVPGLMTTSRTEYQTYVANLEQISRKFTASNPGVKIYLYQTWGHVDGSKRMFQTLFPTFEIMNGRLSDGFRGAQRQLKGNGFELRILPVGDSFAEVKSRGSEKVFQNLYTDDRHPSRDGSYLSALTIANEFNRELAQKSTWKPEGVKLERKRFFLEILRK